MERTRRVLLVYDVEGWAWHHMSRGLVRFAPPSYDVEIISSADFGKRQSDHRWISRFDGVLEWYWSTGRRSKARRVVSVLASDAILLSRESPPADWRSVAITEACNVERARVLLPEFDGVIAVNAGLYALALGIGVPCRMLPAGVDTDLFLPRPRVQHARPRIGWCGKCRSPSARRIKGFDVILDPVRRKLGARVEIDAITASYVDARSHEQLAIWFSSLDIFLCTSMIEGSPMPPREAAACGLPVVATGVGDLAALVEHGQTGFVTGTYSNAISAKMVVNRTVLAIERLVSDPELRRAMGERARARMEAHYSWRKLAARWLAFVAGTEEPCQSEALSGA